MKYAKLLLSLSITCLLIYFLNTKQGIVPPLGKFLNPFMGFWQNAVDERHFTNLDAQLPGLLGQVKVEFDERLVPHVYASNDEDLFYMQGFITAKYRLWQMEISTHSAAGRLCEIAGEKTLEADRLMRRTGMVYGAEKAQNFIAQDSFSQRLLQAYCKGVNAYISTLAPKDYPVEYKLLDYAPERWEPIKVALLLKNMARMLSIYEYDIENTNFITMYGKDEFRKLYPDFIADEDPIIPIGTNYDFSCKEMADINGKPLFDFGHVIENDSAGNMTSRFTESFCMRRNNVYGNFIEKPDEIRGSNNWAVSGSKTKSGKPILCNDPHLSLSLPSIWYEMHLVSPNMNVYGATLPGSPTVVIGFNDSISWGVTNGGRDVRDWYRIKFKDVSCNEYEFNGEWRKTERKVEKYVVRDRGIVYDTVLYTVHGPVVFDKNFDTIASKKNLAMAWTAHLPSNEFKTFYGFNTGKNYDDYIQALNHFTCPAQNFVFASRHGDIAIKEQGRFPIRKKSTEQGKYIADGSNQQDTWSWFIPAANNPTIKNPERGFVSSANQHPTDSTYPYFYPGVGVYENYRNRRINRLLTEAKGIDVDFMKKMQNDNFNLHASEAIPVLLALLDQEKLSDKEKDIAKVIGDWNFLNNPGEVASVYFEIWWNELRKLLWDEMLDKRIPMKQPNFYVTVQFLKWDSTSHFYDHTSTPVKETREDIVLKSFQSVNDTLLAKHFTEVSEPYADDEDYNAKTKPKDWGTYKNTRVTHMAFLEPFSVYAYNGGNLGVINATNQTNGPSWRMIVDEGDMKGYVVYPGGQSGNPGSKFYDNMIETWAKGGYYVANFSARQEEVTWKKLFTCHYKPVQP